MADNLGRRALGMKVTKLDTELSDEDQALLGSHALNQDDEFSLDYWNSKNSNGLVMMPSHDPRTLERMVYHNNTLAQCVAAYATSIDGTGYAVEPLDGEEGDEDEIEAIRDFFGEPYPGCSFTQQRKLVRRDQESIGYAYLEVVRNAQDDIMFLRHLPARSTRMMRLGAPVPVQKTLYRGGKPETLTMRLRERRYLQKIGQDKVYFKEFGASRDLDWRTGEWAGKNRLPYAQRATEVIMFGVYKDPDSAYHLPRWINQIPSVLGSRKAEEQNLTFLTSGGIPPVLITIAGGAIADSDAKRDLQAQMQGGGETRNRAAVVEILSTSGSMDKDSAPAVNVHRFGAEQAKDAMFENYDARCEDRVRGAFRLPPVFLGKAESYNFASAMVSYVVAEAQVFKPEREEFDEVINTTLMRSKFPGYAYRSLGMTLRDIDTQIKAVGIAADHGAIDVGQLLSALNESSGLNLKPAEGVADKVVDGTDDETVEKSDTAAVDPVALLGKDWSDYLRGSDVPEADVSRMARLSSSLSGEDLQRFDREVSENLIGVAENDPAGVAELIGHACREHTTQAL